ncbi:MULTISPECIES: ABC transporter substrate-binding protein [Enterococcus]|uniref:ABC transporter substrate-binding protein n=1 Tax=Enterococcus TaxID=1350 RepID=UPI00065DBDD6|nr:MULTISPECIES: ABC transporter substrate-binding protein [Enterococcus]KAF1303187.1 sugar ABC transporter substrate-binding protein [Enterococcus sp. JM9B]
MKNWQKTLAFAGAAALTLGLSACGSSSDNSSSDGDSTGTPTLLMYRQGDKPENYDALIDNANKIIEKEIGAKLKMEFIGWGDWDQKMSTIVASGESYDISIAQNYVINAQKGAYADLTELAPKLAKKAYEQLPESYIKGNTIDGKLYAFPVNGNVYAQQVLTFNKELVDKYDLDISKVGGSYESATEVLKQFHEKEPNIPAFAIGQSFNVSGNFDYVMGKQYPFGVKVDDSGSPKIINPYEDDDLVNSLKVMHEWYEAGLIPSDAATNTTAYNLNENTWFMREETQGPMDYGDTALTNAAGGKELVSRPLTDQLKSTSQAQMANYVVGNTSKNKEKAVELLGLLNSNPELLNGLVYGVEGEQWEKVGDNHVKFLEGYTQNTHLGAWNTGDSTILYTPETVTDEMITERDENIENAVESPILGFNFKQDKVKTEITNIANVMNRYASSLSTGTVDPEENLPKLNADLKTAGWEKVQKEMQSQLDEFVAESK